MPRPNDWKPGDDVSVASSSEGDTLQKVISYFEDWSSHQSAMLQDACKTIAVAKAALQDAYVANDKSCTKASVPDADVANGKSCTKAPVPDAYFAKKPCLTEDASPAPFVPKDPSTSHNFKLINGNTLNVKKSSLYDSDAPEGAPTATPAFESHNPSTGEELLSPLTRMASRLTFVEPAPSMLPGKIRRLVEYLTATANCLLQKYPPPTGLFADFVRGRAFEMFFVVVILANVLVLILSTDNQIQNALSSSNANDDTFFAFDEAFTCFYVLELACRLYAHRLCFVFTVDWRWNLLDALLTILAIEDVLVVAAGTSSKNNLNILRLIRLMKLLKTLRLLRILRAFRELRIMLNSIVGSVFVMAYALVLIIVVMFAFGIFLSQGTGIYLSESNGSDGNAQQLLVYYWGSVGTSMASLYMAVLGGENWRAMSDSLLTIGEAFRLSFFAFVAFFLLVIVNTVTSVFVESAIQAGEQDSNAFIKEEMSKIQTYVAQFKDLFRRMDLNGDGVVDFDELLACLERKEMIALMSKLMIDVHDAKQFLQEVSVRGQNDINLDTFVEQCLKIRGPARSIDLISFAASQQNVNNAILMELSALSSRNDMIQSMLVRS